jgi:dTMP kinase
MPDMNGLEFMQAFRALEGAQAIPLLMITAHDEKEVRYRALEAGAYDFLPKPVDAAEFLARARNMLKLREASLRLADHAAWLTREVELDDAAVHLLFSANRWEARAQLLRALRGGADVVCDRYAYSGAAFTAAKGAAGLDLAWCKAPDAGLPAPDLILFMDLPPAAAAARAGFGGERYETPALQAAVRARFAALRDEVAATAPGVWHDVDAAGTVEEVAARIAPLVEAARARVRAGGDAGAVRTLWNGAPLEEPGPLT